MPSRSPQLDEVLEGLGPPELEGHDDVEDLFRRNIGEGLLDVVGKGLRDRAEVGVDVLLVAGHVAEMGEEDVVGALLPVSTSTSESETRIQPWMNDTMDVGFECLELEDVNRISEQDEESYKEEELYQKEREKILERKRKEKIQERLMKDFPEEFEVKASPKSKSLKDSSKENMINPSPKIKTSSLKDRIRIV